MKNNIYAYRAQLQAKLDAVDAVIADMGLSTAVKRGRPAKQTANHGPAGHSTGYKLANDGQDTRAIQVYLGHRNITHTCRYTELSPDRFMNFWND